MWVQSSTNLFDGLYLIAKLELSLDRNDKPIWSTGSPTPQYVAGPPGSYKAEVVLVRYPGQKKEPLMPEEGSATLSFTHPSEIFFGKDWPTRLFRYTAQFRSDQGFSYMDLSPATFIDEMRRLVEEEMPDIFEPIDENS